ncbi:M1 family metallopeptidase [Hymenobacter properus]|uniref:Aminopeptidase N n=1 Tax=Hymenobacter properus TaxID=2791026 RepID=A0A931BDY7_9BACT|nr:M1 family metallopeptidase [Hymenobacter properus]MBF9141649.1 M1 family metallopeptidase [Hymenobacter properus]MBR7720458.1 M1 family metallopeptidase [Microvirga sp. SRT04]
MKYLVPGLTSLLLLVQLAAAAQATKPRSSKPVPKAPVHKKAAPAATPAPAPAGLVVPSWLPAEAPLQPAATILTDILDTKLDVRFDYKKQHLLGTAVLTLRSHFYPQSEVTLDAKGFDIQKIELMGEGKSRSLNYNYNRRKLVIALGQPFPRTTPYQLRIVYVAKPNELPQGGSAAITSDKGLYFINPLGTEKNKPRQIWTQGETEASSCWFPTIDKPNQRMTQEISLTVEKQFKTLSNGMLTSSHANADGTRTDTWKLTQPHAPYLATMVVGDFAVVNDSWHGKPVDYYVEPQYAGTARAIFGHTPEMLDFFSKKLGVEYPWEKYAQVAVRDYVSGAMENTTATTHGSTIQATKRDLLDANYQTAETVIAHELFHHWFGDYVTCESWSNLPLNESFADYSEYLWAEYKYGPDEASLVQEIKLNNYLEEATAKREPLIRYRYVNREDMFDRHSYDKGGRVLHMLRKYVGDDAFFTALNHYLTQNKLSAVEISKLRTAFEETTGEDLTWFFNQWFMQRGHPELHITHSYANGQVALRVQQTQDTLFQPVYRLPVSVAVWTNGNQPTEHRITVTKADQTFTLPAGQKPVLVKFDSENQLLAQIDEDRSQDELVFQFYHAKTYQQKSEVMELLQNKTADLSVSSMLRNAMNDKFWQVRRLALDHLRRYRGPEPEGMRRDIQRLATTDRSSRVRAQAIATLATFPDGNYGPLYGAAIADSSALVAAAAIQVLAKKPELNTRQQVAAIENTSSGPLILAIADYYALNGALDQYPWFLRRLPDVAEMDLYAYFQSFGTLMTHIPPVERDKGIRILEDYARNAPRYEIRLGAYKSLALLLPSMPSLKATLQNIREKETDDRLKAFYNLM